MVLGGSKQEQQVRIRRVCVQPLLFSQRNNETKADTNYDFIS